MQLTPSDVAAAALVARYRERAGRGVDRAVPTEWQFHPVKSGDTACSRPWRSRATMACRRSRPTSLPLLDNLLDQVALALERGRLEGEAREFAAVPRARPGSLGVAVDDRPGSQAVAEAIDGAVGALRRSGIGRQGGGVHGRAEAAKLERYVANLTDLGLEPDRKPVEVGGLTIDLFRRSVVRDGEEVHLTPKEYSVLAELAKHPGRVLTHAHLLRTAWGPAQESQTDYLRVAVRSAAAEARARPGQPEDHHQRTGGRLSAQSQLTKCPLWVENGHKLHCGEAPVGRFLTFSFPKPLDRGRSLSVERKARDIELANGQST